MQNHIKSQSRIKVKVELDFSNHATKSGIEKTVGVDISKFAKKVDLASLKSDTDKLNEDKLKIFK